MAQPMPTPRQGLGDFHRLVKGMTPHRFHQAHDTPHRKDRIMSRVLKAAPYDGRRSSLFTADQI
jgi:hypothetical protein